MKAFEPHALRDLAILSITIALWGQLNAVPALAVPTGLMTGLCFLLLHEWGHLFGAARVGAAVRPGPLWGIFLFDVEHQNQSREQFLSLSLWGFAATAMMLFAFGLFMPWDTTAGRWSWYAAITLSTLTVIIEFPIAWRVYRGHPIPNVAIFRRGD